MSFIWSILCLMCLRKEIRMEIFGSYTFMRLGSGERSRIVLKDWDC